MKNDEFAFFNQQLAAMVRDGIPLETALRRLCADMRRGPLRAELEHLEADLAKGAPLRDAVRNRKLPELYRQMLEVGAQSNDLAGVLTMLADHYQRRHVIATRLKGLMVYPAIVLCAAFLLSLFISLILNELIHNVFPFLWIPSGGQGAWVMFGLWAPPLVLGLGTVLLACALSAPQVRRVLRWRVPAFKEAGLAQVASAIGLMIKSGVSFDNALQLAEQLERGTPAQGEIETWRKRLASGQGNPEDMMAGGRVFPPLFAWTVAQTGEDLGLGFQRASEIFQGRAAYRTELLLYSAMPCSVVILGLIIVFQIQPVISVFNLFMSSLR